MAVTTDLAENTLRIQTAIRTAAKGKADILLTPEGSLSGYHADFDPDAVRNCLREVTRLAAESQLGLGLGTCFVEADDQCYNQLRFYNRDGTYLGFHSKQLLCGPVCGVDEPELEPYSRQPVRTFVWESGLQFGGLICNDLWANPECTPMPDPHLLQQLGNAGAKVVFHAVNGGRDGSDWSSLTRTYHETNLRLRARAAQVWVVTVDCATPEHLPTAAPSGVVSPEGEWLCQAAPQGEDLFFANLEDLPGLPAALPA